MKTQAKNPADEQKPLIVTVPLEIPIKRLSDLLCNAFEGGSNYWYMIEKFIKPPTIIQHSPELGEVFRHLDYPCSPGGALLVSDEKVCNPGEKRTERLDLEAMARGLKVMSAQYPRHFGNFLSENDDGETGDVFLQCCLFGELVYG